ncbi:UNVERIFIED_ORG: L-aspartate oxidase [Clostridium botulinum]|uniref:L-aspartate oxidase n=1 Tax=Clostridium TaxID=1485 RepID=UPI000A1781D8|nr:MULTISPECIES: L-aspartate oxidase [Clostridium]MCS6131737.1 L-aspartate oxidase [Clostridium botulinum]NFL45008.1 L-aspartate oxidase [Clostridium botulinum]NFL89589.1 L-aspartate oxidase [Clostridium botulinum]
MVRNKFVDVLVVGSGVSGLYCALNLNENLNVLVVCKSSVTCTNTYLAQGGISTSISKEDIPVFIEDTLKAGQYKNDLKAVEVLANESMSNIKNLISLGVNFDKNDDGTLNYTKEGAHSVNRIVHTKDNTGESVAKVLIEQAKEKENIMICENTYFVDIIENENKCIGGILLKDNDQINVYAKNVVLATGGIGGLFSDSTNQRILKGDSLAIAKKHDIKVKDINYIQIHPTVFYDEGNFDRRFLISESLRGEGGKLLNINGDRFINELLPRDVVSKAVYEEMKKTDSEYVYLDITFLDKDYIMNRFSSIYKECLKRGTDITKDYIKVSPAQHFFMGGVEVDINAVTSMKNLYAVGETSCTGIHGANRLASNSLLEGLVFSKRCANLINSTEKYIDSNIISVKNINKSIEELSEEKEQIVKELLILNGGMVTSELFSCR